jgi:hypothetical protein
MLGPQASPKCRMASAGLPSWPMDRMPEPGDLMEAFSLSRGGASGWSSPGSCRPPTVAKSQRGKASGGTVRAAVGTWRRAESTRPRRASPNRKASEADEPADSGGLPEMP